MWTLIEEFCFRVTHAPTSTGTGLTGERTVCSYDFHDYGHTYQHQRRVSIFCWRGVSALDCLRLMMGKWLTGKSSGWLSRWWRTRSSSPGVNKSAQNTDKYVSRQSWYRKVKKCDVAVSFLTTSCQIPKINVVYHSTKGSQTKIPPPLVGLVYIWCSLPSHYIYGITITFKRHWFESYCVI